MHIRLKRVSGHGTVHDRPVFVKLVEKEGNGRAMNQRLEKWTDTDETAPNDGIGASACHGCIPMLYRFAYLTLGDEDRACTLVASVCIRGEGLESVSGRKLQIELLRDLYHRCQRALFLHRPGPGGALDGTGRRDRLLLALRFGTGLPSEEARRITGLPRQIFYRRLSAAALRYSRVSDRRE